MPILPLTPATYVHCLQCGMNNNVKRHIFTLKVLSQLCGVYVRSCTYQAKNTNKSWVHEGLGTSLSLEKAELIPLCYFLILFYIITLF